MIEKTIYLEDIDPLVFWGINNVNFKIIKSHFPKIKIVARGDTMKVSGEKAELEDFDREMELVLAFVQKYNKLTEDDLHQILREETRLADVEQPPDKENVILYGTSGKPVQARTPNQQKLVQRASKDDLLFAIGPAGSGKTYTAIALAVRALKYREVKRLILTRPAVEAGEHLGFLPGDLKDKLDPYLQPLYDALHDMIPAKKLAEFMVDGTVQIAPLAYMRGRTLSNAFVILDEAQNTTVNQLKMFLTRMGKSSKFIVTGDITQIDLPNKKQSGLLKSLDILKSIPGISFVTFDTGDIVRHNLVKDIVHAYEKYSEKNSNQ